MFEKLLSRVGIGAPRLEMVLHDSEVIRGELLHGSIRVSGGITAQQIHHIDLALQTSYCSSGDQNAEEVHSHIETLRHHRVCEGLRIQAGESRDIAFELVIPMITPISLDIAQVWLKTELDVSWNIHDRDYDPVRILPDPATGRVLETLRTLGFVHISRSGDCLALSQEHDVPFTQVFTLVPKGRMTCRLSNRVQRLDLLVRANNYDAEIQIELNRHGKPVSGWLPEGVDKADNRLRFRLRHNQPFPEAGLEELVKRVGSS